MKAMRVLVVVLDGASFVFTNTFCWFMEDVMWFWSKFKRTFLYVDEPPLTPCVLNSMFTGLRTNEHGVKGFSPRGLKNPFIGMFKGKYIWDLCTAVGLKVRVFNVPVRIPPIYLNVDLKGHDWVDYWLPPKERFEVTVKMMHEVVKENIKNPYDLFIVWYPIPDQAHHHFFATIHSHEALHEALKWYNTAFKYARELIELSRPDAFLIVSDHGFMCDFESYYADGIRQHIHVRDALAVTNVDDVPKTVRDVFHWVGRRFNL
ncbi:MAG: hypothetical protein DRJ60_00295 [Thermoprotei archaeon]|nr:MAG: hypothetical protein DRJ60_00295 [Thermoprotei archaeon]